MRTNVQLLFDLSKYERLKTPEQEDFTANNFTLLKAMPTIFEEALKNFHTQIQSQFRPAEMDNKMPAESMCCYIRQAVLNQFQEYCKGATKTRFKLLSPDGVNIYIKKLTDKRRPMNIDTINNSKIIHQVAEADGDDAPNVFLGYTTTEDFSKITGAYAVCLQGKKTLWETDLFTLGNSAGGTVTNIAPPVTPTLKPGTVSIKRKAQNE